jgi:hypothetical protein
MHESWQYKGNDVTLYATNLYSGTDADVDGTERFAGDTTTDIDLTLHTYAVVDIKFTGSDATDDLYLNWYKRRDISWTGNELRWKSQLTIANDGTETEYHYTITPAFGPGHFRLGMVRSGSTTTFDIIVVVRTGRLTDTIIE